MWEYVKRHRIPRSLYTDRGSVYYAEGKLTDFGRAMKELNIVMIFAKSPQAKGRVGRFYRTLQGLLIKALRCEGISNIAEANKYLKEVFIDQFNEKFSVNPELPDVHRPANEYQLDKIFCYKTTRQVRNDYTISLNGEYIQLLKGELPLPRPKRDVTVSRWLNGQMHISFNKQEIVFEELKEKPTKKGYRFYKPSKDHPWRKWDQKIADDKRKNLLGAALG